MERDAYSWLTPFGYEFKNGFTAFCYVAVVVGMWSFGPALCLAWLIFGASVAPMVGLVALFYLCGLTERFLFRRAAAAGGGNPDPFGSRLGSRAQRACWASARMHQRF